MTKPKSELLENDVKPDPANPNMRKGYSLILLAAALLAVVFGAGVVKGFTDAGVSDNLTLLLGIVAIWFTAVAVLGWLAAKVWPNQPKEPVAPSTKRSNKLLYFGVGMGAVLGLMSGIVDNDGNLFFSNGPLQMFPALVAIAVWMIVIPIVTLMWWRGTDEHDRAGYADGANVAGHAYLFIAPGWWVATRAGLLPAQDPMIVLLIVASIWSAVYLYRKYF